MSTQKQLSLLLYVLLGGMSLIAITGAGSVILIRSQILHLARETSPAQVKLAELQQGFEHISALFARMEAAYTTEELSSTQAEFTVSVSEVQTTSNELARMTGADGNAEVIRKMAATGQELSEIAAQRLQAREHVVDANRKVGIELASVERATRNFSDSMKSLQQKSQDVLASSRNTSLTANSSIKAMLEVRAKIEELRSIVQEVRGIEKKFRLNPLRDKAKGVLDSLDAQNLSDKNLLAQFRSFTAAFNPAFNGDSGLLAARAAIIASPDDAKARTAYDEKQKALLSAIDALSLKIAEGIDPLELEVSQASAGMNHATELISMVSVASSKADGVNGEARSLQALAWQLLASSDPAKLQRAEQEVRDACSQASADIAAILELSPKIGQQSSEDSVRSVRQSFASAEQMLVGPGGVASVVKQGLTRQQQADVLFSAALNSIRAIAKAGSNKAHSAEDAQQATVNRISSLSNATMWIVMLIGGVSLFSGITVGSRVRASILKAEAELHGADEMSSLLSRVRKGAQELSNLLTSIRNGIHTLHGTAQGLTVTSDIVTKNVESMEYGAEHLQTTIRDIAVSASDASETGAGAAALVDSANAAVEDLSGASREISKVTELLRSIAFQIRLLGLNAAIEAAHAGDVGSGFMVVAHEVKKLADTASLSTAEIDRTVKSMGDHVEKVGCAMNDVAAIILSMQEKQKNISAAVEAQSRATREIVAGIHETAAGCRGGPGNIGLQTMAQQLASLAVDLEKLSVIPAETNN